MRRYFFELIKVTVIFDQLLFPMSQAAGSGEPPSVQSEDDGWLPPPHSAHTAVWDISIIWGGSQLMRGSRFVSFVLSLFMMSSQSNSFMPFVQLWLHTGCRKNSSRLGFFTIPERCPKSFFSVIILSNTAAYA